MAETTYLEQSQIESQLKRVELTLLFYCVFLVVSFFFGVPHFSVIIAGSAFGAFFTHQFFYPSKGLLLAETPCSVRYS
jgi:hypothetical protein